MSTIYKRDEFIQEVFKIHDNGVMEHYLPWVRQTLFRYAKHEIKLPDSAALGFANAVSQDLVKMIAQTNHEAFSIIEKAL